MISGKIAIQPPVILELPGRRKPVLGSCRKHGGRIKTITRLKNILSLEFWASGISIRTGKEVELFSFGEERTGVVP
jgi:uncharacterized membrane protein